MEPQLTHFQRSSYDAAFRHPTAHNLDWGNVRSILGALGDVVEEHNGNLKVTRNGQILVMYPPLDKNVTGVGELMDIRHFLERSAPASPEAGAEGRHPLVGVDHHETGVIKNNAFTDGEEGSGPYGLA